MQLMEKRAADRDSGWGMRSKSTFILLSHSNFLHPGLRTTDITTTVFTTLKSIGLPYLIDGPNVSSLYMTTRNSQYRSADENLAIEAMGKYVLGTTGP